MRKVLILEDEQLWREILVTNLQAIPGIEVITAGSWTDATSIARNSSIDFFIADLNVGTGIEFGISALTSILNSKPLPTLVITAAYNEASVQKCHALPSVKRVASKMELTAVSAALTEFLGTEVRLNLLHRGNGEPSAIRPKHDTEQSRRVFVVHGRDERLRNGIFAFLRALDLNPLEWEEAVATTEHPAPYIGDVVETAMNYAQAIVILMSGDETVTLKKDLMKASDPKTSKRFQPRANVLFEAGFSLALYPGRSILVQIPPVSLPSDLDGRHYVAFDGSNVSRNTLRTRLEMAGCSITQRGSDWLTIPIV